VSSFSYESINLPTVANYPRKSFKEEKKVLFDQPDFTPDVSVYKVFFRWYAKNAKGSIRELPTLGTVLATVGIFSSIFGLREDVRKEIEGVGLKNPGRA
jgi:hypothetical protein